MRSYLTLVVFFSLLSVSVVLGARPSNARGQWVDRTPKSRSQRKTGNDITSLISESVYDEMLKHRNNENCPAKGFYTYYAFITAAKSFSGFATSGDINTQKREIAAFLAQTSHETTG